MNISLLGPDLTEHILSLLPIQTIIVASSVCKQWRAIVSSPSFPFPNPTWFFLYGQHNLFPRSNQAFAFDPKSFSWISLPFPSPPSFSGSGGFIFSSANEAFLYASIPDIPTWLVAPPLHVSRRDPLIGVFGPLFIVVGGVRYVGGLVDIEEQLAVEVYHSDRGGSWEICPPIPVEFNETSSQHMSSAMLGNGFYVFGTSSSLVTRFDVEDRSWSEVRMLRPSSRVRVSFLVGCQMGLVLAGLCFGPTASFSIWRVDEAMTGLSEITAMPEDLLYELFDRGEGEDKFATLKCVGGGNMVFVFNEEYYRNFPACICEINNDVCTGLVKCYWRKVPLLPDLNQFHKVISFCSTVSLANILDASRLHTNIS